MYSAPFAVGLSCLNNGLSKHRARGQIICHYSELSKRVVKFREIRFKSKGAYAPHAIHYFAKIANFNALTANYAILEGCGTQIFDLLHSLPQFPRIIS